MIRAFFSSTASDVRSIPSFLARSLKPSSKDELAYERYDVFQFYWTLGLRRRHTGERGHCKIEMALNLLAMASTPSSVPGTSFALKCALPLSFSIDAMHFKTM